MAKREPKPRLFVGSSGESLPYARVLHRILDPADATVTVWERSVFLISDFGLDSLLEAIRVHDFGVFVFAADDVAIIRKRRHSVVRDNVLFELGLFMGRLGRERTFVIAPKDVDLHLPSDLMGWNVARYNPRRTDRAAALATAAGQIRLAMQRLGRFRHDALTAAIQSVSKIQFAPSSLPPYDPARIRKVVIELESGAIHPPRRSRK